MSNTINSNLLAQDISRNLNDAHTRISKASTSIASGNKITSAGDDPAALSIGTSLKTNVNTFKTALSAASQAKTVLGVIDGALTEISKILSQQKSVAVRAGLGNLSDVQRGFLNLEFQSLTDEVDRLAQSTKYNGLGLIDGSLSPSSGAKTNTAGTAGASALQITFTAAAGTTTVAGGLVINGVTFDFDVVANEAVNGASIVIDKTLTGAAKAQKIADIINNQTVSLNSVSTANPQNAMTQANRDSLVDLIATVNGSTISISSKKDGGPAFLVSAGNVASTTEHVTSIQSANTITSVSDSALNSVTSSYSAGVHAGSLGVMNSTVTGTMGHSILQTNSQTQATTGWTTVANSDLANASTIQVFGSSFTLKDDVTNSQTQIKRSTNSDLQTLQNIAQFLNNSDDPNIANFYFEVQQSAGNNQLKVTAKSASAALNNAAINIGTTTTLTLAGGVANGINASRITDNDAFIGKISDFTATMTGTNRVELNVKVGNYTYTANIANTAPTSNSVIRMRSTDLTGKGGSFDLTLAANQGVAVASQSSADTFAENISKAIKELEFYQTRKFSGFDASGLSIAGTTVSMTSQNFNKVGVSSVKVDFNKNTQQGSLTVTLQDGRVLSANSGIGEQVNKGELLKLTNSLNSNESMNFIWGSNIDFSDPTARDLLTSDLLAAFKSNQGGVDFQVGLDSSQSISIQLGDASTKTLYAGKKLDVSTAAGAEIAGDQLDYSLNHIITMRATVGSLQSRFDYAASNIATSIQNLDAARELLLDTDIPTESTKLAVAQVMLQASISVLAQMNTLPQNLLKLIG